LVSPKWQFVQINNLVHGNFEAIDQENFGENMVIGTKNFDDEKKFMVSKIVLLTIIIVGSQRDFFGRYWVIYWRDLPELKWLKFRNIQRLKAWNRV
jgi:hypothetical protein